MENYNKNSPKENLEIQLLHVTVSTIPEKVPFWVIPCEAVTEPCRHRLQFASWSNILLISIEIALFLLKYIKYYQSGQIGVGPRTDFHQIGTLDMEWLFLVKEATMKNWYMQKFHFLLVDTFSR